MRAQMGIDALADDPEHFVARRVAIQVVDQFESVEIDIGNGERSAIDQTLNGLVEGLFDAAAIQGVGERVVLGKIAESLVGEGALCDVLQRSFDASPAKAALMWNILLAAVPSERPDRSSSPSSAATRWKCSQVASSK